MAYYITPQEQKVLNFLTEYIKLHDYSPTQREIGEALGTSRSLVEYFLTMLEKKEKIKTPGKSRRNIQLI